MPLHVINSADYWNDRFETDWEAEGGPQQTRFFCRLGAENLPAWLLHAIRTEQWSLCDWGCALGDGTDLLHHLLRPASSVGIDISEQAVARARERYPNLDFQKRDLVREPLERPVNLVFTSNTIEHLAEPWTVLERVAASASHAVVVLMPANEFERHPEHLTTFTPANVLLHLRPDFGLVGARLFDTGKMEGSLWSGQQFLLTYLRLDEIGRRGLSLADLPACSEAEVPGLVAGTWMLPIAALRAELEKERASSAALGQSVEQERAAAAALRAELEKERASSAALGQSVEQERAAAREEATTLARALEQSRSEAGALTKKLARTKSLLAEAEQRSAITAHEIGKIRSSFEELRQRALAAEETCDALLDSTSWRLTGPLRGTVTKIRTIRRKGRSVTLPNAENRAEMTPFRGIRAKMGDALTTTSHALLTSRAALIVQRNLFNSFRDSFRGPPPAVGDALTAILHGLPTSRAALIFQPQFFHPSGNNMYFGGAERYMLDLADLLFEEGFEPVLIQMSNGPFWIRQYGRLRVFGLPCWGEFSKFRSSLAGLLPRATLAIFSPLTLNPGRDDGERTSIGISHGIYWDDPNFQNTLQIEEILSHASACSALVSVDTATINWFRGTDIALGERFVYIPNYVDCAQFAPAEREPDGKLIVLYPRRLYGARGYDLVLQVAPHVLERHPHVAIEFCGKGDPADIEKVRPLQDAFGNRIRLYNLPPEQMHEAYRRSDIVLIPTVASEGTSLSCIEAMASGKAIIATHVGGLSDLVIDRYNGLLIEPRASQLEEALETMIGDPELRAACGRRARHLCEVFSIEHWRERWRRILPTITPPSTPESSIERRWAILHPATDCIEFDVMRQRPQQLLRGFAQAGVLSLFQNFSRPPVETGEPLLQVLGRDDDLYPHGQVVYLYYPFHALNLERFSGAILLYDVLDDPAIHPDPQALEYHNILLRRAAVVITSSRVLQEQLLSVRPDALLVPNGVWPGDFAGLARQPRDAGATPCVGYAGALADWIDFDLLQDVAAALPDWQFRLAGPCTQPAELEALLRACPNVTHLGTLSYEELPGFYGSIDVGIVPFRLNEITHKVSPIKMFEYLAAGRPVVATAMHEIIDEPCVLIAERSDFANAIRAAMALRAQSDFVERALEVAQAASWANRAETVLRALDHVIAEKAHGRANGVAEGYLAAMKAECDNAL